MSNPLLTVLLPVYNSDRYLAECLLSIQAQTFTNWRLLAIDDGSSDRSPEILARFARSDERIRVVTQTNQGLIATLNLGIGMTETPLVARMDSDDVAVPDRFRRQIEFMAANTDVAVCGTQMMLLANERLTQLRTAHPIGPIELQAALTRRCVLNHPTVMFRRDVIAGLGAYRSSFIHAEDYDLWLRVSRSHQLANLPDVLLHYRVSAGQVSSRHMVQQVISTMAARTADAEVREGRAEPFATCSGPVDAQGLLSHGVLAGEIEGEILAAFESRATLLQELGLVEEADAIALSLAGQTVPGVLSGPVSRASSLFLRGALGFRRKHYFHAAACISGAVWTDSRYARRMVRSLVRRVGRFTV